MRSLLGQGGSLPSVLEGPLPSARDASLGAIPLIAIAALLALGAVLWLLGCPADGRVRVRILAHISDGDPATAERELLVTNSNENCRTGLELNPHSGPVIRSYKHFPDINTARRAANDFALAGHVNHHSKAQVILEVKENGKWVSA